MATLQMALTGKAVGVKSAGVKTVAAKGAITAYVFGKRARQFRARPRTERDKIEAYSWFSLCKLGHLRGVVLDQLNFINALAHF